MDPILVALPVSDPAARAQLIAQASQLPDDKAELLLECVDASAYGGRQKLIRIGGGVAGGLVLGFLVARLAGGKKGRR